MLHAGDKMVNKAHSDFPGLQSSEKVTQTIAYSLYGCSEGKEHSSVSTHKGDTLLRLGFRKHT